MQHTRKIPTVTALIVAGLLLAGCGGGSSGSTSTSAACFRLGQAESTYNKMATGAKDGTITPADAAKSLESVTRKLDDITTMLSSGPLYDHAAAAKLHAGRVRVALLTDGSTSATAAETKALVTEMNAADAACAKK